MNKFWSTLLIILFAVGAYLFITEINKSNSFLAPIGLILQIFSFVAFIFVYHKNLIENKLLFFICAFLYSILLMFVSDKYEEYQVSKYGKVISAKIIQSEIKYRRRTGTSYLAAEILYTVNYKEYHQEFNDTEKKYKIGDSVKIKCSIKEPELFIIVE